MKILVGYDGTPAARDALDLAKTHAGAFGGEIHIVMSLVKGSSGDVPEIEQAEGLLTYAQEAVSEAGIPCQKHLLIRGMSPGEDLVQFALEKGIDEIIVGIRRRSKVGKLLMGSTAQYVILEAPCPVVTIR